MIVLNKEMKLRNIFFYLILSSVVFLSAPSFAKADNQGQINTFFVDQSFSSSTVYSFQVSATLEKVSGNAYIYVDNIWFNNLTDAQKQSILSTIDSLSTEFTNNIYPNLTNIYGSEWNPSIAPSDKRVTMLFYPMKPEAKGYFRNTDEYEKTIVPMSNQREMIYLNTDDLSSSLLYPEVSHEFTHVIEFNQKENRTGTPEDVWLNELRAEYSPTLLGYSDPSNQNSYLKQRIKTFVNKPYVSLTNWTNDVSDYGVVSMFGHYLVDQYGTKVLVDSLKSNDIGIASINDALKKESQTDTFVDVFTNWVIASYVNDCSVSTKYCYANKNLTDMHLIPFSNLIPFSGDSTLSIGQSLSDWSANWQKFGGAGKDLKLDFDGKNQDNIRVFSVVWDYYGKYEVKELKLDADKKGELIVNNLGIDKASVLLIPLVENESGADSSTQYSYSIMASTSTSSGATGDVTSNQGTSNVSLPFSIDKPLDQMNREELMTVLLKVIIYLLSQGKTIF